MYTSYIGKKFIELYKQKYNKPDGYSAQQFFDEVVFPLFFDDELHLMHVSNSPFFQKPKQEDVEKHGSRSKAQYANLKTAIENEIPNMSIFVGFAAKDIEGTTSGQLTDINFNINTEDTYASWIGEALSIGVSGGFVMLIDQEEILLSIFEGWTYYRKYLSQTPNLKDKQIETWNGHWLCHCFSDYYNTSFPLDNFHTAVTMVLGKIAIPTQRWSQVIFALAKKYPKQVLTAYAYNLSQTNTTLGFINLYLPEVFEMYELTDKIFIDGRNSILKGEQIEKLETFFNFKSACKQGAIGIKSIEPAQLREYMPKGSVDYAQGKDFKFSDEDTYINYSLYKLWIIAMINKTELLDLATKLAQSLIDLENQKKPEGRGKTTLSSDINSVKDAKTLREFIESLNGIIDAQNAELFQSTIEQVLQMPSDNLPLFITLIRFEYSYLKSKK
jgi:hypothetical protein